MTFDNAGDAHVSAASQSADASAASAAIAAANSNAFLQQEAFTIAREIKNGDTQGALKEVESLRAGSPAKDFNTLLASLNEDVQADLKMLGFPTADRFEFSDPDNGVYMGGSHALALNTPDGRQIAYFDEQDRETGLVTNSTADNSETSIQFNVLTGLPTGKSILTANAETFYTYDKNGHVESIERDENGQKETIDPATGKETIVSRSENFFHKLIADELGIDF